MHARCLMYCQYINVGYQKEKLKIDIDEDGTQIAVSGEKQASGSQPRRFIFRTTSQVTKFRKVFWIPDAVVVDQIHARFNDKESLLWVFMPKLVKGGRGAAIEEVKQEAIGKGGHRRTRTVPDKVPERGIPANKEVEMKEVKKDLPQREPEVKEAIPKKEVAGSENQRTKGEEGMKEWEKGVKPTGEVVGELPQPEPEVKEGNERESPTRNEQRMEEGKKDIKADEVGVGGRLPQLNSEEVGEAILKKDEAAERENLRKKEQEMEEEKKDMKATDEAVRRLTRHEPQEVKEAADITMKSPAEEPAPSKERKVPSKEETPAKEETDLEAKGGAAGEKSEECQHGQDVTESTKVEADQVTQWTQEYNSREENGKAETHPSQQEPNIEIQEASQLISDQEPLSDPTEPLEPDNPEQEMDQAETDPVILSEGKFKLFSSSFFAGSAILVSIAVLVIYFYRSKRR